MEEWRLEVLSKVETQEDRKARYDMPLILCCQPNFFVVHRIMQKAYALRDAREKARQELVEQKYNQQWRDSCDDARTLDSKALVRYLNQERLQQIQDKMQAKQRLSSQEDAFLTEWNRQLEELSRRENEKIDYRRRADQQTAESLRNQVTLHTIPNRTTQKITFSFL